MPPDQQDLSPQEQASLRKWLDGGLTTTAVTRRGRRRLDGGVRRRWRRLEGDKGCGDDSMMAVTAAAVDDGVGGGRRRSRPGEEGRGGEDAEVRSVLSVICFSTFYLRLSKQKSETFQEISSRLPGTPLPAVTGLVVIIPVFTHCFVLSVCHLTQIIIFLCTILCA